MKKHIRFPYLLALVFMTLLAACGKKDPQVLLHGEQSKKWELKKETNAGGDKVDQAEDDQTFTFFANGQYTMATSAMTQSGKYTYDPAAQTITMTSEDTGMESAFKVSELDDDDLTLTAPDGSAIKLGAIK